MLDFEGSVTSLLTFLNLGWETSLKNYQKTGIDRGRINTPSYSQVIRPIYHTATNRWTNYERQLGGFKNKPRLHGSISLDIRSNSCISPNVI